MSRSIRFLAALSACLYLAGCAKSAPPPQAAETSPAPYRLTNLAASYPTFWDATRDLDETQRVAAFHAKYDPLFPGFYDGKRFNPPRSEASINESIARSFRTFPEIRTKHEHVTGGFQGMLDDAYANFVQTFPDMQSGVDIYLLHSMGEMDGGQREIGGKHPLIFGADVMARVHDFANERPFFHHELFHVYHTPKFESCDPIWCSLWVEGLAVLAAKRLNPTATDPELLLTTPTDLRKAVDENRTEAVCAVRARLKSEAPDDYRPLFNVRGTPISPRLPNRFAYYVGYLVAQEAEKTMDLHHLAKLGPEEAKPVIEKALAKLAKCPKDSVRAKRSRE